MTERSRASCPSVSTRGAATRTRKYASAPKKVNPSSVAHSPERLEVDLKWIEDEVKGRPYGLDLLLPQKYAGAEEGGLDREAVRHAFAAGVEEV